MVAGGAPYGLDDVDWRALLVRGALLRAVARLLPELHELRRSPEVATAIGQMHIATRAACANASEDAEAVTLAGEQWSSALDELDREGLGLEERQVLRGVRDQVSAATDEDPYKLLFVAVAERASAVYGDAWPGCDLDIAKLIELPRDGRDPYALSGATRPDTKPVVELALFAEGLGPATWAAVPSILVHEAVCHVAARQGGRVDNASPFAEGFMHWAASWFFSTWLDSLDADLAQAAREQADPLWTALTPPASSLGSARRHGVRAAGRLMTWLAGRGLSLAEAEMQVAHLAVALNREEASLARKDHFVVRVNAGPDAPLEELLDAVLMERGDPAEVL